MVYQLKIAKSLPQKIRKCGPQYLLPFKKSGRTNGGHGHGQTPLPDDG